MSKLFDLLKSFWIIKFNIFLGNTPLFIAFIDASTKTEYIDDVKNKVYKVSPRKLPFNYHYIRNFNSDDRVSHICFDVIDVEYIKDSREVKLPKKKRGKGIEGDTYIKEFYRRCESTKKYHIAGPHVSDLINKLRDSQFATYYQELSDLKAIKSLMR